MVNNAGRSIRRSLKLTEDRFHDFERTMQLNYFGAIRLVMGLLPKMREQKSGHVVNISSIGVQTNPPRFRAYVASKAALDAWSNVVSSELVGDGVSFTSIHMPLVRTPMIAPTKIYDQFPTISPGQAADKVITALVDRPHEINTMTGNLGALAHTLAPKAAFRVLHLAYQVFPDSAAARGDEPEAGRAGQRCRRRWPGLQGRPLVAVATGCDLPHRHRRRLDRGAGVRRLHDLDAWPDARGRGLPARRAARAGGRGVRPLLRATPASRWCC